MTIADTTGLETLSSLSHLNLSYNHLSFIPLTHEQALLTHLNLAYNRIEQLLSLSDLTYLSHVDLAANCLMHHDVLAPLSGNLTNQNQECTELTNQNQELIKLTNQIKELHKLNNQMIVCWLLTNQNSCSGLTKLESVDLRYNPLSTHPRHRQVASSWLNPSLASSKPILDNEYLSRAELLQVNMFTVRYYSCTFESLWLKIPTFHAFT